MTTRSPFLLVHPIDSLPTIILFHVHVFLFVFLFSAYPVLCRHPHNNLYEMLLFR